MCIVDDVLCKCNWQEEPVRGVATSVTATVCMPAVPETVPRERIKLETVIMSAWYSA